MTNVTTASAHVRPSFPGATALSTTTTAVALAVLTAAGLLALDASRTEGSLAGVGYVVAIVAAVPAAVALLLAVATFLLRRRSVVLTRTLGWAGLLVALLPALALGVLITGPR